jgi:hypothetical protein
MMGLRDVKVHKVYRGARELKALLALMETPFFMETGPHPITLEMLAIFI